MNGLPQGSVLSTILFNIYTNDQPIHSGRRNFIYADDLCVTAQHRSFKQTEDTIEDAMAKLTQYMYRNVYTFLGSKQSFFASLIYNLFYK